MYYYGYHPVYWTYPNQIEQGERKIVRTDYGPEPFIVDIEEVTKQNKIIAQHCGQVKTYK